MAHGTRGDGGQGPGGGGNNGGGGIPPHNWPPLRPYASLCRSPGAVVDLVRAIQKEEIKVHVDLPTRIKVTLHQRVRLASVALAFLVQEITLENLGTVCYPTSAITDKVAGEIAKVRKASQQRACCQCLRIAVHHLQGHGGARPQGIPFLSDEPIPAKLGSGSRT